MSETIIATVLNCIACGAGIFRASSADNHPMVLDLEPVANGELSLIPCTYLDGRQADPTAVYGEPGEPRYQRHNCPDRP